MTKQDEDEDHYENCTRPREFRNVELDNADFEPRLPSSTPLLLTAAAGQSTTTSPAIGVSNSVRRSHAARPSTATRRQVHA
mmetsp:Transcript_11816/g.21501  ORF Transcript_11816/g.21501 Transcript_11816/m.21501 type:complete len:81 (-) Transcript_11816:1064-1306(-)